MAAPGDEIATKLKEHMASALEHFKEVNGGYPERVILFRDSIYNAKPATLKETEVAQLVEACEERDAKCLYCLVQRSANVELYAQGFYLDTYKNVVPGTVLTEGISRPAEAVGQEYFLISSSQRMGFTSPARYTVLHDSTGEPLYKLHQLSYKLCHSYFNIANSVKSPSPILYARKLAKFMVEHSKEVTCNSGGLD